MAQEIARALKWGFKDRSGRALLDDRGLLEHDDVIGDVRCAAVLRGGGQERGQRAVVALPGYGQRDDADCRVEQPVDGGVGAGKEIGQGGADVRRCRRVQRVYTDCPAGKGVACIGAVQADAADALRGVISKLRLCIRGEMGAGEGTDAQVNDAGAQGGSQRQPFD